MSGLIIHRQDSAKREPHFLPREIQPALPTDTPDPKRAEKIKTLTQALFGPSHKRFILALSLFP